MKNALKKITAYTWAFIAILVAFFTAGMFTLGSVKDAGDSVFVEKGNVAYYSLSLASNEKLDSVYVNVGTIYTDAAKDITVSMKAATSSAPSGTTTTTWPATGKKTITIANFANDQKGSMDNANYNWVPVATKLDKAYKTIGISASADIELNEIVCLNTKGEQIKLSAYTHDNLTDGMEDKKALAAAFDAQDSFDLSEGAYYRFTPEESYYLSSVENVLGGKVIESDGDYHLSKNFNYLATVLFVPTVAMFGSSPFALRLPAFLATCALVVFAYLLVRQLTKNDKVSLVFAIVLCLGGMATTLGRLGAPYVMVAAALVMSAYFMYRFFAKGISSNAPVKGAMNILVSGLAAAFALAMDILSIFPVIGILVLFSFGIRRQKLAYELALAKTEGLEEEMETEEGETVIVNKAAKAVTAKYNEKNRLSYGFAALGFLMGTIVLMIVSAILCYTAAIKANGGVDEGFIVTLWRGVKDSALSNAFSPYKSANWSSVWAWWLPWRAATVYTGVDGVAAGKYLAWNVTPNLMASCLSLVSLAAVTVKVAYDIVKKNTDKKALRLRRGFFVLLGGMAATMIAGGLKAYPSPLYAMGFHTLYLGFIPLALTMLENCECCCKTKKLVSNVVICLVVVAVATVFVLSVPSMYGIVIAAEKAKVFGWTTFVNNGYFR